MTFHPFAMALLQMHARRQSMIAKKEIEIPVVFLAEVIPE